MQGGFLPDAFFALLVDFVAFGAGFSLVFALAQLFRKDPGLSHCLNFLVFTGNSLIQLIVVLKARGTVQEYPLVFFLSLSALFFIGPANYLYHHTLLNPGQPVPAKLKAQFVPAALAVLCGLLYQLLPAGTRRDWLAGYVSSPLTQWPTVILALGVVFIFACFLVMTKLALTVLNSRNIRAQARIILAAFLSTLVSIVLISLGFILGSDRTLVAGGALVTLINLSMFFSNMRYPDFYRLVESEIKKTRYERSLLKGLDTELVNDRLGYLMGKEHIYKDFDLSLESLARQLSITPHQLSQFMNERLRTSFRRYINSYRIEEAKKILASDPDRNILTVCFDVGFNSKSTFNQSFRKYTNQTPSEFRQEHQAKGPESSDL